MALSSLLALSACGTYRGDASGGGAELSPTGANVSRPRVSVSFAVTGQTNVVVQSYAELSAATYGNAVLATKDQDASVRRALFPATARGEALDVVFVVDTTGSMGSSMDAVKAELHAVVAALATTNPDTRFGLVAYRDRGDAFESLAAFRLDGDQSTIHRSIDWLNPNGGGDYPEHVYAGVDAAIRGAGTWRPHAKHHVVVIGDAPAQQYPDETRTKQSILEEARRRQIRVHTVAIACSVVCKKELGLL